MKFNNSKLERTKNKRRERDSDDVDEKRPCKRQVHDIPIYLFCDKEDNLHDFATFDALTNVRRMVTKLQDIHVLSKTASDAEYLLKCLVNPSHRYETQGKQTTEHR